MSLRADKKTERIDLGDGEWVEILVNLNVKQACLLADTEGKGLSDKALEMLSILIVAWSDEEPVTPEAIAEVRADVAEAVMERFQAVRAGSPKASSSRSTGSSRTKRRSRASTP